MVKHLLQTENLQICNGFFHIHDASVFNFTTLLYLLVVGGVEIE